MKKQIFYLASAVLAAGLTACSSDELDGVNSVKLASNQILASAPQSTSTRVGIAQGESNYTLSWKAGDEFGAFSANTPTENRKFSYSTQVTDDATVGVFTAETALEDAKYAYYPYDKDSKGIAFGGEMAVNLPGSYDYVEGEVKAPMFGIIEEQESGNKAATFTSLTAVLEVKTVNLPAGVSSVKLTSYKDSDPLPLWGSASVSGITSKLTSKTIGTGVALELDDDVNAANTSITINLDEATTGGEDKTFYFVLPAQNYDMLVFSLDDDYDGSVAPTDDTVKGKVFAATLNASAKYVYTKNLRYSANGNVEDDAISELNESLAELTSSNFSDFNDKTDLTNITTDPIIILPTVAKSEEQWGSSEDALTITLTNVPLIGENSDEVPTITIKQDDENGYAPAYVKIVATAESGNTDGLNLDIELPNSTVEIVPGSATTYPEVISNTSSNTLKVSQNATISKLKIKKGNVFGNGGTITKAEIVTGNPDVKTYYFYTGSAPQNAATNYPGLVVANETIYKLLSGAAAAEDSAIKLDADFTIEDADVTFKGTTYLDLNGKTLTVGKNASLTVTGASGALTLKSSATGAPAGTITSSQTGATINVTNGGTLTISKGETIEHTSGNAINANNGTVTLTDAVINGDIEIAKEGQGSAALTLTKAAITGDVTTSGAVTLTATSTDNVTIEGDVTLSGASASGLSFKEITGDVTVSDAASITVTKGDINGNVAVSGDNTAFTLTAGTIKPTEGVAVTASDGAKVTIDTNGKVEAAEGADAAIADAEGTNAATIEISGTVENTNEEGIAVKIANGAAVEIKAGTVSGIAVGAKVTKGSLTISGGALQGQTAILALPESEKAVTIKTNSTDNTAKITSTAAGADGGFALYNSNEDGSAIKAVMDINGGTFDGDISSDKATYFISAGKFTNCDNFYAKKDTYVKYTSVVESKGGYLVVSVPKDE